MRNENQQADHFERAYNEMANTASVLMNALCEIRDKADPYTYQLHWVRQTANEAVKRANKMLVCQQRNITCQCGFVGSFSAEWAVCPRCGAVVDRPNAKVSGPAANNQKP